MKRLLLAGILGVVISMAPVLAHATITFTLGNNPQTDENVLLTSGDTGTTVFGTTNQTGLSVAFTSTEVLTVPSSGQARVEAQDTVLNNVAVTVPGGTYTSLIFNAFNGTGTAEITVGVAGEPDVTFDLPLGNGENFLTIVASGGERITETTIDAPGGFADLRQVRIGGAEIPSVVPEPGSLLLLGSALAGLGFYRWRKNR
jgi:hypothetical protein